MANIEKSHIIDKNKLSGEFYFASILQEAYACGVLDKSDIENIQVQCIEFLAYKVERYNSGESSSIRVEAAENIMKSNLYTIGVYLKSLPDVGCAVDELKIAKVPEMYEKGRKLIDIKFRTTEHIYKLAQKNRVATLNYTYNATLSGDGIGLFFKSYNPDYEAHECGGSIDYQLCNPVIDLAGVEFIQKYLESLFLENEFCKNFEAIDIHHLLCGYDEGYKDLLINVFEQVLVGTLGCSLMKRNVMKLDILEDEAWYLQSELSKDEDYLIALKISKAAEEVIEELSITNLALSGYIEESLPKITSNIVHAVRTNTLMKVFVTKVNPDLRPRIEFSTGVKMDDEEYRKLIDELTTCRYSSDKLALIKEKVRSFADIEDVLFDAFLSKREVFVLLNSFQDIEIALLIKRHPFSTDIEAVDLSETEQTLRLYLKEYIRRLAEDRKERIFELVRQLIDE
ncbi:MAG: hypothetical protein K0S71_1154 [Clostridia bacterium]|nr:hypothetical protein [Clostridia bacterium]